MSETDREKPRKLVNVLSAKPQGVTAGFLLNPLALKPGSSTRQEKIQLQSYIATPKSTLNPTLIPASQRSRLENQVRAAAELLMNQLRNDPQQLLKLNRSRKRELIEYWETLGDHSPSEIADESFELEKWIYTPASDLQRKSVNLYFLEISLLFVMQCLLLRRWSILGNHQVHENDYLAPSIVLASWLRPHLTAERPAWNFTQQSIFSWFKAPNVLLNPISELVKAANLDEITPQQLIDLIFSIRQEAFSASALKPFYETQFLESLLKFSTEGSSQAIRKHRFAFLPSVCSGIMLTTSQSDWDWIGMESNLFGLVCAEMAQLWNGPIPPPLWVSGMGIECHKRDQLTLGNSTFHATPREKTLAKISEVQSCHLAIIMDNESIKMNQRSRKGIQLRKDLSLRPYFRDLKTPTTSLSAIQSLVASTKLRNGGILWWGRERAIDAFDGQETLQGILENTILVAEWDLSQLAHNLPGNSRVLAKYLYLFRRENQMEVRSSHVPKRFHVSGILRSHLEIPWLMEDLWNSAYESASVKNRGGWTIHDAMCSIPQSQWIEAWPSAYDPRNLHDIDWLKKHSAPLANIATIRPPIQSAGGSACSIGFLIGLENEAGEPRYKTHLVHDAHSQKTSYQVIVRHTSWGAPLRMYLESELSSVWLRSQHKKSGSKTRIDESILKLHPVPHFLSWWLGALDKNRWDPMKNGGVSIAAHAYVASLADRFRGEWKEFSLQKLLGEIPAECATSASDRAYIKSRIFMECALRMENLVQNSNPVLGLFQESGVPRWKAILQTMPTNEYVHGIAHPLIRHEGQLPPHIPIAKIRVPPGKTSIQLLVDSGHQLILTITGATRLFDILMDQINQMKDPTWSEINDSVILPLNMNTFEQAMSDILKIYESTRRQIKQLEAMLKQTEKFTENFS